MWQGIQSVRLRAVPSRQAKRPCEFKQPAKRRLHGHTFRYRNEQWTHTQSRSRSAPCMFCVILMRCRMNSTMRTAHIKLTVYAWPFAVTTKKIKNNIKFISARIVRCVSLFVPLTQGDRRTNDARSSRPSFRLFPSCFSHHTIVGPALHTHDAHQMWWLLRIAASNAYGNVYRCDSIAKRNVRVAPSKSPAPHIERKRCLLRNWMRRRRHQHQQRQPRSQQHRKCEIDTLIVFRLELCR